MDAQQSLSALLQTAALLLHADKSDEQTSPPSTLESLLEERLQAFHRELGNENENAHFETLSAVQLATATEALSTVEKADAILRSAENPDSILLGTRDWQTLRTLLSLVFKWGMVPLLASVTEVWVVDTRAGSRITDIDSKDADYHALSQLTTRIMAMIFPHGLKEKASQTPIAAELAKMHTTDILRPNLTLGWLPKSLSTPSLPVIDHLRPFTMRLLSTISPAVAITALGNILSHKQQLPSYVARTASSFLTQQLLRPSGVLGLCESVFGNEETLGEEVQLEKLEKVSRALMSVPAKMDPAEYYRVIVPRIIQLLSDKAPSSYRQIAAYTLSQILGSDKEFPHRDIATSIIYSILHIPLRTPEVEEGSSDSNLNSLKAPVALSRLLILIANCDPSPDVITNLLTPIIPLLYSLLFHLSMQKVSDPRTKESVQGLLSTWGKIVDALTAIDTLWTIIVRAEPLHWKSDGEGDFQPSKTSDRNERLSLLLPSDNDGDQEPDIDTNLFDFYPDPVHFVSFLKSLDRSDVVSELFIKILEAYRDQRLKGQNHEDPMKTLHYLQLFMQMQIQLLNDTSSSILRRPEQLLAFIKQVLESSSGMEAEGMPASNSLGLENLRISQREKDIDEISEDSDDDDPDSETIKPDDELLETALNLLLSVMESREDLSVRETPLLNDIFALLEPLALSGTSNIRPLAQESRMVITARSASSSSMGHRLRRGEKESIQDKYQKALKLLQDPILPVRAHGLLILRELVTAHSKEDKDPQLMDPALVPAILSIFLQSIQDDDSYIFLNGVQGLAAMVDGYGREVLSDLIREYSEGLERNGATMSEQDLNIRVRIGEALGIVIRRCGTSLGKYRDMLIPALFRVFRLQTIPVTLRTSSLSLLADAIDTYALVMIPYIEDLSQGMIDLLQVESQVSEEAVPAKKTNKDDTKESKEKPTKDPGDNEHMATNPKYPPLRRAALHLLSLLIRSAMRSLEDGQPVIPFSANFMKRARITLGYVAGTESDTVARVMAREIREELAAFESQLLGYDHEA